MALLPTRLHQAVYGQHDYWQARQIVKEEAAELAMLERQLGEIQHALNIKRAELTRRRAELTEARRRVEAMPIAPW